MAQRVQVILVDDMDGGEASETVSFGLDGSSYEMDLSGDNAAKMREVFASYVGQARRSGRPASGGTGQRQRRATAPAARPGSGENAAVRAWAKENGHAVSERGRISTEIRNAYEKAQA